MIDTSDFEMNKIFWEQNFLYFSDKHYKVNNIIHSATKMERDFITDIENKNLLHIFCSFGMNSFVLEDLGATVTGVDYNKHSIDFANKYKNKVNSNTTFICEDFFKFNSENKFDVIYGSYGVLDWVHDVDLFIDQIYNLLIPGGRFIFVEFHSDFFEKKFSQMGGVMYGDNQYEIKSNYKNRVGVPKSSPLGNGYTEAEDVYLRPFVHDTNQFISKLKLRGFSKNRLEFYDYINFRMGKDVEISRNKFRNKELEPNQKMSFGLDFTKI